MEDKIVIYLPWFLSFTTIYLTILMGNKSPYTWPFAIVNQILWIVWIYASGTWGMMPMTVVILGIYIRNYFKWTVDD